MKQLGQVLDEIKNRNRPKNITQEFQLYGCELCEALEDTKHNSLYINQVKESYEKVLQLIPEDPEALERIKELEM